MKSDCSLVKLGYSSEMLGYNLVKLDCSQEKLGCIEAMSDYIQGRWEKPNLDLLERKLDLMVNNLVTDHHHEQVRGYKETQVIQEILVGDSMLESIQVTIH